MIVEGFIAHLVGDYVLQSDWAATEKTKRWWPAVVHGLTYTLPFLFLTQSPWALAVIAGTHIVIDRYRLARHLVWLKNHIAPRGWNPPWTKCHATGYPPEKDTGFAVALLIVADNTMHLVINSAALAWLA
ncbi:DUF3307 domain-containing protein [Glycomyces sp. YM15]|uniref:DUF3307 domain-containing protein n=1 Tax=Glycomyces sp. YM15 TaxID=2800446 RepID=UPI001964AEC5|nr:DUF3307 domain-containing protein [Glycomyces sp. YM15]